MRDHPFEKDSVMTGKLIKTLALSGAFMVVAHAVDRMVYNASTEDITITVQGRQTDTHTFLNGDQEKTKVIVTAQENFDVSSHEASPYPDLKTNAQDKMFDALKDSGTYKVTVTGNHGILGNRNRTIVAMVK